MAELTFNAAKKEPMEDRDFKLIPEDDYLLQIVKSEIVPNKKKTAKRLNFQAKVINGEFKGAIIFIGLNWEHPNEVAQDISDREFKSICDAVGKGEDEIADTGELHNTPFVGTVKHSAPSGEYTENGETKFRYGPKAEIKKYSTAVDSPLLDGADIGSGEAKKAEDPPWVKEEKAKAAAEAKAKAEAEAAEA